MEMKTQSEHMEYNKGSSKRKVSEISQIYDLILHVKLLENQGQAKPKTSRRSEIIKIRAEINERDEETIQQQQNKKLVLRKNKPD
jgi:hypothetical protein